MRILNKLFPNRLYTPHIELGISKDDGMKILNSIGEVACDDDGSFRVDTHGYGIAIYVTDDVVTSVWFNDPIGRLFPLGKARKIKLYLKRYGQLQHWEMRMDNGWMRYWFNESNKVQMVYGIHKDVIRFNQLTN